MRSSLRLHGRREEVDFRNEIDMNKAKYRRSRIKCFCIPSHKVVDFLFVSCFDLLGGKRVKLGLASAVHIRVAKQPAKGRSANIEGVNGKRTVLLRIGGSAPSSLTFSSCAL